MSLPSSSFYLKGLFLFVSLLLTSCLKKEAPPFPYGKKSLVRPLTKTFEYTKVDTISWERIGNRPFQNLPSKKLNWDQLSSKSLALGFPFYGSSDLPTSELNFDSLPYIDFDLSTVPKEKIAVRILNLGQPDIQKAGELVTPARGTRGLRSLEEGFGLPAAVNSAALDREGKIWFGTQAGFIAYYDSDELFIYGQEQGIELSGNVLSVLEDENGLIWAASQTGRIVVLDLEANLIYELSSPSLNHQIFEMKFLSDGTVWFRNDKPGYSILDFKEKTLQVLGGKDGPFPGFPITPFEDSQGLVWMTSMDGAKIFDRERGVLKTLNSQNGLPTDVVYNIYEDREKRIWISTAVGVSVLSPDRKTIQSIGIEEGLRGMEEVYTVFQSNTGQYWFGTGNGLVFSYDWDTRMIERYVTSSNTAIVYEIFEDGLGQIWVVDVRGGMFAIDQNTGRPASLDGLDGLDFNTVWNTVIDNEGRVWLGTEDGLAVVNPETEVVTNFTTEQGLVANYMYNLEHDSEGRIWSAGSGRGVSIVDPNKSEVKQMKTDEHLGKIRVAEVYQDVHGTFWMGGVRGELLRYDLNSGDLRVFRDSLVDDRVNSIVSDGKHVYVGTQGSGIFVFDPDTGIRQHLSTEKSLISDDNLSLTLDEHGLLWAAGLKGVERIDLKKMEISLFRKNQGLGANDVYAIAEHEGTLYAGTSKGITYLRPISREKDEWDTFTIGKDQGMTQVDVSQNTFSFDKQGRVWGGINAAILTVVDPVQRDTSAPDIQISSLNILDEKYTFRDANYRADVLNKTDSIFWWNNNKYVLLSNSQIDSMKTAQSFMRFSEVDSDTGMPLDLKLDHDRNFLSFSYNALQFKNKESTVYTYILEGIDRDWSAITSETRSENYRDLPPGDYTFKVASKGFNNIWSSPVELSFSILPPWWKTTWAYLFYFIVLATMSYLFVQYRQRWLKKENQLLEERVNQRTAQLKKTIDELETTQGQLIQSEKMASLGELTAGIAHEIQNPMNFINNFSEVSHELLDEMMEEIDKGDMEEAKEISSDIKQNLEKISHHGHRASSIVRGMLEHSRNSSGQKEDIDINVLADEYLRLAYHGLRAKDKSFNAKFETDFDDSIGKIEIIPQDIGRVMLNLINNAFYAVSDRDDKESDESYQPTVKVTTKKLKDQVKITVEDNGSGIPQEIKDKIFQPFFTTKPSGKGTGLGLSLTYDIITQGHSGALELDSEVGKGTVFTIFLPVKQ